MGQSIGLCPKPSVFNYYIDLEYHLMNLDRCRTLYQKFLECYPSRCEVWVRYAEFEEELEENERASAIFELAIGQEALDTPELVWKKYIDHEMHLGNREKVEELYERLLQLAQHSKVIISYAQFESTISMDKARTILERGITTFKESGENEMRHQLLLALKGLEESIEDNEERIKKVNERQANKVKKVRHNDETGIDEEYVDYVFPEDEANSIQMKLLENAKKWKNLRAASNQEDSKRQKVEERIDLDKELYSSLLQQTARNTKCHSLKPTPHPS